MPRVEGNSDLRIAYSLFVYKEPAQVKRLLRAIYDPMNCYLVHIDRKTPEKLFKSFQFLSDRWPNVRLMSRSRCNWGGWSQVAIEIHAMEQLLRWDDGWKFYINLSGQDFPLVPQNTIKHFLAQKPEANMFEIENPYVTRAKNDPNLQMFVERWRRFYLDMRPRPLTRLGMGPIKLPLVRRSFPAGVEWHRGSQWKILSRAFCEYVVCSGDELIRRLVRFFRFSRCADETFFQTLIMNGPFRKTVADDNKRFMVWPGPKLLSVCDYERMRKSGQFFARKFDIQYDARILSILEEDLSTG